MDIALLDFATGLARDAGAIALQHFRNRQGLEVQRKAALDLVTLADREVEHYLRDRVHERFPQDAFFGEEGRRDVSANGRTWVVDPIDGTFNFVRGHDAWAVSIGVVENGVARLGVVHAPARGETLSGGEGLGARLDGHALPRAPDAAAPDAVVGIGFAASVPVERQLSLIRFIVADCGMTFRRNGASSVSLMMLAQRQVDAFVALAVSSWDVAAGLAAAQELGYASSVDWRRTPLTETLSFACAPPQLLERLSRWEGFGAASSGAAGAG